MHEAAMEIKAMRDKILFRNNDTFSRKEMDERMNAFNSKRNERRGPLLEASSGLDNQNKIQEEDDDVSLDSIRKSLIALWVNDYENAETNKEDDVEPAIELSNTRHKDWDITVVSRTPTLSESTRASTVHTSSTLI